MVLAFRSIHHSYNPEGRVHARETGPGRLYGEVIPLSEKLTAQAARQFSDAADAMVNACRLLESCGIDDKPVERLLQALEDVTQQVHQLHPPEDRLQIEPADLARPGCNLPQGRT